MANRIKVSDVLELVQMNAQSIERIGGQVSVLSDKVDSLTDRVDRIGKGIFEYSSEEAQKAAEESNKKAQAQAAAKAAAEKAAAIKKAQARVDAAEKALIEAREALAKLKGESIVASPKAQAVAIDGAKKSGTGKWDGSFIEGTFEGTGKKAGTFYQSLKLAQSLSAEEFQRAKGVAEERGFKYSRFAKAFLKEIKEA